MHGTCCSLCFALSMVAVFVLKLLAAEAMVVLNHVRERRVLVKPGIWLAHACASYTGLRAQLTAQLSVQDWQTHRHSRWHRVLQGPRECQCACEHSNPRL